MASANVLDLQATFLLWIGLWNWSSSNQLVTLSVQGQGLEATADLGGSIITGMDGNPLAILAKQLEIPLHDIDAVQVF